MELKMLKPKQAQMKVIEEENGPGYMEGYGAVFNNVDYGGDKILPGAFKKTIAEKLPLKRIKLVDNHNAYWGSSEDIIGVVEEAKEDDFGLWIKARFSKSQRAQEVRDKIKDGILDALSIGYDIVKYSYEKDGEGDEIRLLKELGLSEISVVAWGMNPLATITGAKNSETIGLPKLLSMLQSRMKTVELSEIEKKELRETINNLKALLDDEPSNDTQNPKAAIPPSEPDDHSDEIKILFEELNVAKEFEKEQALLDEFRNFGKSLSEVN